MSRAAVLAALRDSDNLVSMVAPENIYPNYSRDERPTNTEPFIILRWGNVGPYPNSLRRAPRILDVCIHIPVEVSTSYSYIDSMLNIVDEVLSSLEQVEGSDGETVTCIKKTGMSNDLKDPGYNTIYRYISFDVLHHRTKETA